MCPSSLFLYTVQDGGSLTQIGDFCYELVPTKLPWNMADLDCEAKGGQLVEIASSDVQVFASSLVSYIMICMLCLLENECKHITISVSKKQM